MKSANQPNGHTVPALQPSPVLRRKLSHEVLDRLLHLIESGPFGPGQQLPSERELMELYGVGRPAVREALQSLRQMGMITISHGERARVISPRPETLLDPISRTARHLLATCPETLDHLKGARLLFEQAMVRLAIANATEEDMARLRHSHEVLAAVPHRTKEFIAADMAFHETIASMSGNPLFAVVSKAMLDWLMNYSVRAVHLPGSENLALVEHKAILDCILARDTEGAVKAMSHHLTRANELYKKLQSDAPPLNP